MPHLKEIVYILKEIVCVDVSITTKILDFSESCEELKNLKYDYENQFQLLTINVVHGNYLYNHYMMLAGNNNEFYQQLISEFSENENRQLKMKDLVLPDFVKYRIEELVKQSPCVELLKFGF